MIIELLKRNYNEMIFTDVHSFTKKSNVKLSAFEEELLKKLLPKQSLEHFVLSNNDYQKLAKQDQIIKNALLLAVVPVVNTVDIPKYSDLDANARNDSKLVFFALFKDFQKKQTMSFDFRHYYRISGQEDVVFKEDDFIIRESTTCIPGPSIKIYMQVFFKDLEQKNLVQFENKMAIVQGTNQTFSFTQITHVDNQACLQYLAPKPTSLNLESWNKIALLIKLVWSEFDAQMQQFIVDAVLQQEKNGFDQLDEKTMVFEEVGRVVATHCHAKIPVYIRSSEPSDAHPENLFDLEDILKLTPLSDKEKAELNLHGADTVYRHPYSRVPFSLADVLPHPETLRAYEQKLMSQASSSSFFQTSIYGGFLSQYQASSAPASHPGRNVLRR